MRAADRRVGVDPGGAALHDRNDDDAENDAAQQDADDGDRGPKPPGLIEDVRLRIVCHLADPNARGERSRTATA